jgi:hypothetical protein
MVAPPADGREAVATTDAPAAARREHRAVSRIDRKPSAVSAERPRRTWAAVRASRDAALAERRRRLDAVIAAFARSRTPHHWR